MDWLESPFEAAVCGTIFIMVLGCAGGSSVELMPHLSGWSSSEETCDPEAGECPDADEVCVYNPYVLAEGAEVDLNGYQPWMGSECGDAPDDEAICVQRPDPSDGDYSRPVCSCDRTTYESPAAAHADGASIDYFGECRPLMPHVEESSSLELCDLGAGECGAGETCVLEPFIKRIGNGGYPTTKCEETSDDSTRVEAGTYSNGDGDEDFRPEGHGFCVDVEAGAATNSYPGDDSPVCGCDGQTYQSNAAAHAAGTSVSKQAACEESSGEDCTGDAISCPPTEFCRIPAEEACGTSGECAVPPEDCSSTDSKVCGCDGTTYRNECVAHQNETSVQSTGTCTSGDESDGSEEDESLQPPRYDEGPDLPDEEE